MSLQAQKNDETDKQKWRKCTFFSVAITSAFLWRIWLVTGTASSSSRACRHRSMSWKHTYIYEMSKSSENALATVMDVTYWVVHFECKLYICVEFL